MSYRLGIDVGGTFTDLALFDEKQGTLNVFKIASTLHDPSEAILSGIKKILKRFSIRPRELSYLGHGTTVATNSVIENRGAKTGLITTKGFRDLLEIARQKRPSLYDYFADKPPDLVPRTLRKEITERVSARGEVIVQLDTRELKKIISEFKKNGVEAVAVCLIHSYLYPEHEKKCAEFAGTALPHAFICASCDVLPEFREYERMSTTTMNASLGPVIARYLERFSEEVKKMGIKTRPYITQSSGGIMSIETVQKLPIRTIFSGPSAGVTGACFIASKSGCNNIITFDMGGTSCDVSLVKNGKPLVSTERTVGGHPVKTPMIDIHTIGAGGGSIAWIDEGGLCKVGPRSAGASPGPVAYGKGGDDVTVTDANLVLQRLNPHHLLGGDMKIDARSAYQAIEVKIASVLKMDVIKAAEGIIRIVNANMERAIQVVSVEQGFDPRDFVLMSFGGAGPLHSGEISKELGIKKVLVPRTPGNFCAWGLLIADVKMEFAHTHLADAIPENIDILHNVNTDLETQAVQWFEQEKIPPDTQEIMRFLDMRYSGQDYELSIPIPNKNMDETVLQEVIENFHRSHKRNYGYCIHDRPVQAVTFRLTAVGRSSGNTEGTRFPEERSVPLKPVSERAVYFTGQGFLQCPIFHRDALFPKDRFTGPAVVEQFDSTVLVLPDQEVSVDELGNIIITNTIAGGAQK